MRSVKNCQENLSFHPRERKWEAKSLGKGKKGALKKARMIGALIKGVVGAFNLVILSPIFSRVFF